MSETEHGSSWDAYKRLLGYTRRYWKYFALAVVGFVLNGQTQWAGANLVKYIIDAIEAGDQSSKNLFPVLIVGLFVVRGVGTFIGSYYMAMVARHVVYSLRKELFERLLVLPMSYYLAHNSGHLSAKLIFNVEQVTGAATDGLKTIVREGATAIGLLVYLFYVNWKLSLSLLIVGPFAALLVKTASKRFRKLSRRIQTAVGELNHIAGESINGYLVVKTQGGEAFERARFDRASTHNLKQGIKMVVASAVNTPLVQLLMAMAMAVVIWIALQPDISGDISPGEFVAYLTAAGMLAAPVRALTDVNQKLQTGIAAAQSVFEIIDAPQEVDQGTRSAAGVRGALSFQHVNFAYEPDKPVLQDFSLDVAAGQTVAIVGRSGSGKTTLVNLIPRFFEAQSGTILLDGQPLDTYTLASLRAQIAWVGQKVFLFDDTIANNIAYGALRDQPREAIEAAARAAFADDFIRALPLGYDTPVGQDGVQLSGGQRQRLAIARALLKQSPLLILDEATSALDNESEFHIQAALEQAMQNRTTLVIAHRLSTIEQADWIVVMDQGRMVEQGKHADLLALGGLYAQLHRRQFAEEPGDGHVG